MNRETRIHCSLRSCNFLCVLWSDTQTHHCHCHHHDQRVCWASPTMYKGINLLLRQSHKSTFRTTISIGCPQFDVGISVGTILIFQFSPGFGTTLLVLVHRFWFLLHDTRVVSIFLILVLHVVWVQIRWNLNWLEPRLRSKIFSTKMQKLRLFRHIRFWPNTSCSTWIEICHAEIIFVL